MGHANTIEVKPEQWPLGAVSLTEAMRLLGGITRPTLAKLIREGKLRKASVATKPVICRKSIQDYLAAQEQ